MRNPGADQISDLIAMGRADAAAFIDRELSRPAEEQGGVRQEERWTEASPEVAKSRVLQKASLTSADEWRP